MNSVYEKKVVEVEVIKVIMDYDEASMLRRIASMHGHQLPSMEERKLLTNLATALENLLVKGRD